MPFHFCADELFMLMAMIPFIGIFFRKVHAWWHTKFGHKCHEKACPDTHVEHAKKSFNPFERQPFVEVSKEDLEYLKGEPAPLQITIPIKIEGK